MNDWLGVVAGAYKPETPCECCGELLVLIDADQVHIDHVIEEPPPRAWYGIAKYHRMYGLRVFVQHTPDRCIEYRTKARTA